jgi:hypothetical protein
LEAGAAAAAAGAEAGAVPGALVARGAGAVFSSAGSECEGPRFAAVRAKADVESAPLPFARRAMGS